MSAGPKSVAPVSRPATAITADIMRCSMNGRAMTSDTGIQMPFSLLSISVFLSIALPAASLNGFGLPPSKMHDASSASAKEMCTCMSESSL